MQCDLPSYKLTPKDRRLLKEYDHHTRTPAGLKIPFPPGKELLLNWMSGTPSSVCSLQAILITPQGDTALSLLWMGSLLRVIVVGLEGDLLLCRINVARSLERPRATTALLSLSSLP